MATTNAGHVNSMETVYCTKCYMATPVWKGCCIHCKTKFPASLELRSKRLTSVSIHHDGSRPTKRVAR
jgi:hypothetical protein